MVLWNGKILKIVIQDRTQQNAVKIVQLSHLKKTPLHGIIIVSMTKLGMEAVWIAQVLPLIYLIKCVMIL